jgi:uncharacterized SAM-binding protein YcdF (DUF218 family)
MRGKARVRKQIADIVKAWLIPGSMSFLVAGLAVGVLLLNSGVGASRWARVWLTALLAVYWLLSLPVVSNLLIGNLHREFGTVQAPGEARGSRVLVVVGNGSVHYAAGDFAADMLTRRSFFCVFEAARLYRLLRPDWVIVTGGIADQNPEARTEGDLMREQLVRFQVPADRILLESASRTTGEQVANVARLFEARGLSWPAVVITTGAHMSRVMTLFRDRRLDVVPSVTPELRYDEGRTGWHRWAPSFAALTGSQSALYEYLALIQESLQARRP